MSSVNELTGRLAREETRERLEGLLQSANEAFFEVDASTRTIVWSAGMRLTFGHDPAEIGQRLDDWTALAHPDEIAALTGDARAVLSAGSVWVTELRLARVDGSYAPARVRAFVVREGDRARWVVGSVTDLSAVRALEEELRSVMSELGDEAARERHERVRAELLMRSSSSEALGEWDLRTGEIAWSENVSEVLGYPAAELSTMERVLRHAVPGEGELAVAEARRQAFEEGQGWTGRVGWVLPSGSPGVAEVKSYLLRDAAGDPERLVGSVRVTAPTDAAASPWRTLTPRQREVMDLVRAGRTNKEIAERSGISEQGAKTIVSRLLRTFGAPNRAALAAFAPPSDTER